MAVAAALLLAACGGGSGDSTKPATPGPSGSSSPPAALLSAERCAANKAAGKITFLTPFQYVASVGIIDVVAAEQAGYFEQLCLSVTIQPGTNNSQLVSAGTAQIGGVGGPSDVITAEANTSDQGKVVAVATYGNTSIIEALSLADGPVQSVADFSGRTLGYKGAVPPQVLAMLAAEGVDPAKVKQVSVSFDPSVLPQGQVQMLTAYKSNEPIALRAAGANIKEWDPADFGVKSSFNTQIANRAWAQQNPTAMQDFLRASFHAYADLQRDPTPALEAAAKKTDGQYDVEANRARFAAEDALVQKSLIAGHGLGWQSVEQFQPEYQTLQQFDLIKTDVDLASVVDNSYVQAIYDGAQLRWPTPAAPLT